MILGPLISKKPLKRGDAIAHKRVHSACTNPQNKETLCTLKQNANATSVKKTHLIAIQSSPQIPCALHELLVLVLLHLQLPYPLHADGQHIVLFRPLFPVSFLSNLHPLKKPGGCCRGFFCYQGRAVGHVCHIAICIGRFFDRENSCVCPVLGL